MTGKDLGGAPRGTAGAGALWKFLLRWWWAVCCGGAVAAGVAVALASGPGATLGGAGATTWPGSSTAATTWPGSSAAAIVPAENGGAAATTRAGSSAAASARPAGTRTASAAGATATGRRRPAVAVPVPTVAGLPHLPPSVKPSLGRWDAGPGGVALAAVSRQSGDSAQAGGARLYLPMRQACQQLAAAVTAARSAPPIPSSVLQARYATALGQFADAAGNCQAGISASFSGESTAMHLNQALIQRSMQELAAGARQLYLATSRIKRPAAGRRR